MTNISLLVDRTTTTTTMFSVRYKLKKEKRKSTEKPVSCGDSFSFLTLLLHFKVGYFKVKVVFVNFLFCLSYWRISGFSFM